jgi:alpha-glucosidase
MLNAHWNPKKFLNAMLKWDHAAGEKVWPTAVLNNHDNQRSASRFGIKENDERLKIAAMLLLTQRGTPYLYYGEEIGMRDISVPLNQIKDPAGVYYWPLYKGRDGCRSPMQWNDSRNAGFSAADPWEPVSPNYSFRNVEAQKSDPNSLFNFYRRLISLRKELPALRNGIFMPLNFEPRAILAYLRQNAEQIVLVASNFRGRPTNLVLGEQVARGNWKLALSNRREILPELHRNMIRMEAYEALILVQD